MHRNQRANPKTAVYLDSKDIEFKRNIYEEMHAPVNKEVNQNIAPAER
jgi:hypothetical protein